MNAREAVVQEYAPGELICRQGGRADRAFVLRSGTVRSVVVPDSELADADAARLSRGHDVGRFDHSDAMLEIEGALTGHYLTSLIAGETAILAELPVDVRAVKSMVEEEPSFGHAMARMLARRLVAANKSLGARQRLASRFQRDFQGMCIDFYNLVQRIGDDAEGEDDVLQALSAAKRTWSYNVGEAGGAELTRNTRALIEAMLKGADAGARRHLNSGDLLCRRGDPGDSVYLLVSGRLSVRVGGEQFGVVRPGETVGEIGVLLGDGDSKRPADIQAIEPSEVGVIPTGGFPELVEENPKFLVNLCRLLCLRVKMFEQLASETDDALSAVAARFTGDEATFERDVRGLRDQVEIFVAEQNLPLHGESETLGRLRESWNARREELKEKLGTEQA